jgi:hypothetical protein
MSRPSSQMAAHEVSSAARRAGRRSRRDAAGARSSPGARTSGCAPTAVTRAVHGKCPSPQHIVGERVDGKLIESDLTQRPYKGSHHRRAVNGKRRARATFITYVNQFGQVTTAVRGYKLILLACQQSTLPVIGGSFPATYDERQAVLELLAELRAIWPTAPVTWFGGDALYDRSKRFQYELEFVRGVHPVAQTYNKFSESSPYHETKGVPKCRHGWMKRQKARSSTTRRGDCATASRCQRR